MNLIKINFSKSKEYSLLIRLVLLNQDVNKEELNKINYENLVKIASSNLMLPSLYSSLLKTKKIKYTPKDFSKYLKLIYNINKKRNKELIKELEFIKEILSNQNIKFLFFKGSALLLDKIYCDLGERMIGDIDLLVKHEIYKCQQLLNKYSYFNDYNFRFWKRKHIPKMTNKNKLFSVEPHVEVINFSNKSIFSSETAYVKYLKNKYEFHMIVCILNSQINDFGSLYAQLNLRAAKDFIEINKLININNLDFIKTTHARKFLLMLNQLGLYELNFAPKISEKIFLLRFKFKRSFKFYFLIDNFICDVIRSFPKKIMKLIEYVVNSEYRSFINKTSKI